MFFGLLEETYDRLNDGFVARGSIDHGMIYGTVRPLREEVSLNEGGALAVYRINQCFCIANAGALGTSSAGRLPRV